MATFNLTGLSGAGPGISNRDKNRSSVLVDTIVDFTSTTQPNGGAPNFTVTAALSGNASGDTIQVFTIPATAGTAALYNNPNTGGNFTATFGSPIVVGYAGIEVLVADTAGNSGTLQITDGSQTYTSALTVQTTGVKAFTAPPSKLYTAADTLDLVIATGAVNCVVRVFAMMTDLSSVDYIIWN